jgi:hypothetical protein
MDLTRKLTHTVTITPRNGFDNYGAIVDGTPVTSVPCFIYGTFRRIAANHGNVQTIDFTVIFGPSTTVEVGDSLSNGLDKDGNTILSSGKVIGLIPNDSYYKGRQSIEVLVERN